MQLLFKAGLQTISTNCLFCSSLTSLLPQGLTSMPQKLLKRPTMSVPGGDVYRVEKPQNPFSRQYYKRARLGTNLFVGAVTVGLLLYDWDTYLGHNQHVFRGVRPAVRRTLDWLWGVEPEPSAARIRRQRAQQQEEGTEQQ